MDQLKCIHVVHIGRYGSHQQPVTGIEADKWLCDV